MRSVQYALFSFMDIHVSFRMSSLKRATWFSTTMRSMFVKFSPSQVVRTTTARMGQIFASGRMDLTIAATRASRIIPMPHRVTMRRVVSP